MLADLVAGLAGRRGLDGDRRTAVVMLDRIWRFHGGIAELAAAVRDGDADRAIEVLAGNQQDVRFGTDGVRADIVAAASAVRSAALAGDAVAALSHLQRHRVLCAHRTGPFGVQEWSRQIERWLQEVIDRRDEGEWYIGRPLLVTAND